MRILVLNPGSSTLKFRLLELADGTTRLLSSGLVDHVEGDKIASDHVYFDRKGIDEQLAAS